MSIGLPVRNTDGKTSVSQRSQAGAKGLVVSSRSIPGAKTDGSTAAGTGTSANQGGRKRVAGAVQQPSDDSPQPGRVHAELYLHFSEWHAGKAFAQRDCQPRARQTHLAGIGRELEPL